MKKLDLLTCTRSELPDFKASDTTGHQTIGNINKSIDSGRFSPVKVDFNPFETGRAHREFTHAHSEKVTVRTSDFEIDEQLSD